MTAHVPRLTSRAVRYLLAAGVLAGFACLVILSRQLTKRVKGFEELALQLSYQTQDELRSVRAQLETGRVDRDGIREEVRLAQAQIREMDSLVRLPALKGVRTVPLGGRPVAVIDYPVPASPMLDGLGDDILPPPHWQPGSGDVPYPYPTHFCYQGPAFHAYQFSLSLGALCNYARRHHGLAEVQPVVDRLLRDLGSNLRASGPALYVGYPFAYMEHAPAPMRLAPGWVSGFGNARALLALTELYQLTGDPRHKELARRLAASFGQICTRPDQAEPWVSYVDEGGYLWFEEYPARGPVQTHVFNGHVVALMALDGYLAIAGSDRDEVLLLIKAGITTMHRYLAEYRRPGQVNRYALHPPLDQPDYCPSRTPRYAEWLAKVSGEKYFSAMAQAFRTDHP